MVAGSRPKAWSTDGWDPGGTPPRPILDFVTTGHGSGPGFQLHQPLLFASGGFGPAEIQQRIGLAELGCVPPLLKLEESFVRVSIT